MDFAISVEHRGKTKENEKIDKYINLTRELKKLWNMKVMGISIVVGALGLQSFGKETGRIQNQRKNQDYPGHIKLSYYIIKFIVIKNLLHLNRTKFVDLKLLLFT